MPKRQTPKSLRRLSVLEIVSNFEIISFGSYKESSKFKQLNKSGLYTEYPNPLDILPSSLLNEVAQELLENRGLKPYIIRSICTDGLTECRLPSHPSALPLALKSLAKNSSNLVTFHLTCCKNLNPVSIYPVLCSSQYLRYVNLEGTNADDACLQHLVRHTRTIHTLNLARTKITCSGLDLVTQQVFPNLTFLIILGTNVKPVSVSNLAARLGTLLTLEYDNMLQVFLLKPSNCFALTKLSVCGVDVEEGVQLGEHLHHCPHLQALSIENSILSFELIEGVSMLKSLNKLELSARNQTNFSTLLGIFLSQGSVCCNLEVLTFSRCSFLHNQTSTIRTRLLHLEKIFIFNSPDSYFQPSYLKYILSSPNISVLYLQNLDCLTDELIKEEIERRNLIKLSSLSIECCHRISLSAILDLLSAENRLESLHVWSCVKVSELQQRIVHREIKNKNLDLNFQWQGVPSQLDYENQGDLRDLLLPLLGVNVFQEN
ncbi:uncharacterized protein LOC111699786 isoform X2 [Eurytemora carolleeae]|uniref:uncharacterized protein LOC111699786 isoform X2 n=1 Tax=Eurytemora carolleeae TaxID=1294199 RepID=UPI000C75715A|nr:uncharacterized protein LOC111699786 isoform X2 [Eurytemora carolleeae]|eukprot:XP_023326286.1 uncharacterized protein LOC111699786 isoform X2 [Eurytemora affinis]